MAGPAAGLRLSRRGVLSGLAGAAAAGVLAGCGSPGRNATASGSASASRTPLVASDLSDTERIVNWSNWPQYIDIGPKGNHPTIDAFTKKTGISVTYNEDFNDNDEFFAKVRPLLEAGQDTGRDTWVATDWLVARLIRLGYLLPLDKANIPNIANLEPSLADPEYDPGSVYSLPWQVTFAGIAYNEKATGGRAVSTMDQLLNDPTLKGKVTLLTEMRDTVGLVLMEQGKKLDSFTADDFSAAIDVIQQAKDSGQIKGFTGNEYTKALTSGDTAACLAWTGDVVQLRADNPALGYVLPEAGYSTGTDNFVIPSMARHKTNAEKLINYYYDPEVMAEVVAYVNYVGPVTGLKQVLAASDPSLVKNELIFPSEETLARGQLFRSLTAEEETSFTRAVPDPGEWLA
ncbi:MAG: spermidine/putrescine ABC transporter substrate-binding protein [Propionicimonas sp.]|uniref:polyamine ABC transporter substrate-binding protein n=1 Tax=Propionicimonas sp. TaxID=1955623 RepID=UPI003D09DE7C